MNLVAHKDLYYPFLCESVISLRCNWRCTGTPLMKQVTIFFYCRLNGKFIFITSDHLVGFWLHLLYYRMLPSKDLVLHQVCGWVYGLTIVVQELMKLLATINVISTLRYMVLLVWDKVCWKFFIEYTSDSWNPGHFVLKILVLCKSLETRN